jgi:hypothetical protein
MSAVLAVCAVIAGSTLLIVGMVFLGAALAALDVARASSGWPTAIGRVVRSEIRANRSANRLPGYRAVVRYEYLVDGEEYAGRDLAAGEMPYRSARSAARRLAPYSLGRAVMVRYCPEAPEVAVLQPGVTPDVLYLPSIAGLLLLAGLALLFWGGRQILQLL